MQNQIEPHICRLRSYCWILSLFQESVSLLTCRACIVCFLVGRMCIFVHFECKTTRIYGNQCDVEMTRSLVTYLARGYWLYCF